jgi:xanthine phosphoribosyltransferase
MSEKHVSITWDVFITDIQKLAELIKKKGIPFSKILCITKGGLIPAYYLSKLLNIKYIETVCVASYAGTEKGVPQVVPFNKPVDTRKHWLIIDDLVDSGDTFKEVLKLYPHGKTCCVYRKPHSPQVDFYGRELRGWVTFPWEITNNF